MSALDNWDGQVDRLMGLLADAEMQVSNLCSVSPPATYDEADETVGDFLRARNLLEDVGRDFETFGRRLASEMEGLFPEEEEA
jgi:hypothetical protein